MRKRMPIATTATMKVPTPTFTLSVAAKASPAKAKKALRAKALDQASLLSMAGIVGKASFSSNDGTRQTRQTHRVLRPFVRTDKPFQLRQLVTFAKFATSAQVVAHRVPVPSQVLNAHKAPL